MGHQTNEFQQKQNTPVEKLTFANLSNTYQLICEVAKRWLNIKFEGGRGLPALFKDRPKKDARRQNCRPKAAPEASKWCRKSVLKRNR